ncbi:SEP domain-containing protein [Tribonema minus]|uniref:SEP domain-containing protein n=1 Tax=Tribonema minus TaxID=303371 RepID=A0A835ZC87_9STRA|nr:SEP domain-containing protein [Tribonema minus]
MSRMATLDSLKKKKEEEEADSEDEGQEYYAGGNSAQHGGSGLAVVGPPGGRRGGAGSPVQDIFQRASRQEAAEGGEEGADSQITIFMYRQGFTVNDGPFRRLDDPANEPFLRDLGKGIVPRELADGLGKGRGEVHVKLADRRNEDYVPPPTPAYVPFGGEGQTMGSSTAPAAAAIAGADEVGAPPVVDDAQPVTTLQIRLADGRRLRARLNLSHTVRDVQAFIHSEGAGATPFVLLGGYPPAVITDFSQTLQAAGLAGAQLTQKLC